jgi:hypothetical protein
MTRHSDEEDAGRLPGEWLPAPLPAADAQEWSVRRERIVRCAEPALETLRACGSYSVAEPIDALAAWWKPAVGLAAAAALVLFTLEMRRPDSDIDHSLALSFLAADGSPVALWNAAGIQADPVLALVALQEQIP